MAALAAAGLHTGTVSGAVQLLQNCGRAFAVDVVYVVEGVAAVVHVYVP